MRREQTILIVDDTLANLFTLEQTLSELEIAVVKAASGNEALAATLDHDLALCILDVHMPEMDGYELAEIIRQQPRTRYLPIIFLTAEVSDEMTIARSYAVGGVDFLVKPYNPLVLTSKVRVFLELDEQREELQQRREQLEGLTAELQEEIHERKRVAAELRDALSRLKETQASLVQAGKMAALGELAAGVAHEINNPLAGIVLQTRRLLKKADGDQLRDVPGFAPFPTGLERILEGSARCEHIVERLLALSQPEQQERAVVELREIVEDALGLVEARLSSRQIAVAQQYVPERLEIAGNSTALQQVVISLVLNGLDAMEADGNLAISTGAASSSTVWVRVADNGRGISPEVLDKIFDPFFTTKPVGEGTGLGLFNTYLIVREHGGEIAVESSVGEGTTVTVTFPARVIGENPRDSNPP